MPAPRNVGLSLSRRAEAPPGEDGQV